MGSRDELWRREVKVWDIETGIAKKVFHCHSHVLVLAVSPFLGLIAAGEAPFTFFIVQKLQSE